MPSIHERLRAYTMHSIDKRARGTVVTRSVTRCEAVFESLNTLSITNVRFKRSTVSVTNVGWLALQRYVQFFDMNNDWGSIVYEVEDRICDPLLSINER